MPLQTNLIGLPRKDLVQILSQKEIKPSQSKQLLQKIYQSNTCDIARMEGLSKSVKQRLSQWAVVNVPGVTERVVSLDGTEKWLFRFNDGAKVESVLIPSGKRHTLCISTQAGCPVGCAFCATGKQGFDRNLSAVEMIAQIWHINKYMKQSSKQITNVVMMGMGEPLLNLDEVLKVLSLLRDESGFNLPRKRVTVSTSGYVPAILRLAKSSDVALAVSLHAPNDELRNQLVPINRKYGISQLLDACAEYVNLTNGKSVTFEYVMLKDINDGQCQIDQITELLKNFPAKINLIPFNTFTGTEFKTSPKERIENFRRELSNRGIVATIRRPRGNDVGAACGQLNVEHSSKISNLSRFIGIA